MDSISPCPEIADSCLSQVHNQTFLLHLIAAMDEGDTSNSGTHTYVLASGPVSDITLRSDILTTVRIASGIPEMRQTIQESQSLPLGSPCLLHTERLQTYSDGPNSTGIDGSVLPLDSPSLGAFVPCKVIGNGVKHWAGANGEWVALVEEDARWTLLNVYSTEEITLPSIQDVRIHPEGPFRFRREWARMELLKIQIPSAPYKIGDTWYYYAIALFDKAIAIVLGGEETKWRILKNNFLAPSLYTDAILDSERIYAVTEPRGDVLVWEPLEYGVKSGPRVIPSPMLEDVANFQAGGHGSTNWFLASGVDGNILWIRIRRDGQDEGLPTNYMGRELRNCPTLRCNIFARDGTIHDPVDPVWVRQEDLHGTSLFLGVNYPFFLDTPVPAVGNTANILPVFKPDCVFSSHTCCNQRIGFPDWCRIPVDGGVSIISSLIRAEVDWGRFHQVPMWFVPDLPGA